MSTNRGASSSPNLAAVDLLALISSDVKLRRVAMTNEGEYAGPCPFCGGHDRFRVWPAHPSGKGRWWCRGCNRSGDAITYLQMNYGLTFRAACERLGLESHSGPSPVTNDQKPQAPPAEPPPVVPPTAEWQDRAWGVVAQAQATLWSENGTKARTWLAERGLTEETLETWGIGYNSTEGQQEGFRVPRGILLPAFGGPHLWYVKIRRPAPPLSGPKYQQLKDGRPTLYGADLVTGKPVVVLCEGEFDGLLLWQEARDLVDVVALGGAGQHLAALHLLPLVQARVWLVAFDRDAAGDQGATWWQQFSARVRPVQVPNGKDITDFYLGGGDLRDWVAGLLPKDEGGRHDRG